MQVYKFFVYSCQSCKLAQVLQPLNLFPKQFQCKICGYVNPLTDGDAISPLLIRMPIIATNDVYEARQKKKEWNLKIQNLKKSEPVK